MQVQHVMHRRIYWKLMARRHIRWRHTKKHDGLFIKVKKKNRISIYVAPHCAANIRFINSATTLAKVKVTIYNLNSGRSLFRNNFIHLVSRRWKYISNWHEKIKIYFWCQSHFITNNFVAILSYHSLRFHIKWNLLILNRIPFQNKRQPQNVCMCVGAIKHINCHILSYTCYKFLWKNIWWTKYVWQIHTHTSTKLSISMNKFE